MLAVRTVDRQSTLPNRRQGTGISLKSSRGLTYSRHPSRVTSLHYSQSTPDRKQVQQRKEKMHANIYESQG
jgi:hypothetical protein